MKKCSNVYRLISLYKTLEKALELCNKIENNGSVPSVSLLGRSTVSEWKASLIENMKAIRGEVYNTLISKEVYDTLEIRKSSLVEVTPLEIRE